MTAFLELAAVIPKISPRLVAKYFQELLVVGRQRQTRVRIGHRAPEIQIHRRTNFLDGSLFESGRRNQQPQFDDTTPREQRLDCDTKDLFTIGRIGNHHVAEPTVEADKSCRHARPSSFFCVDDARNPSVALDDDCARGPRRRHCGEKEPRLHRDVALAHQLRDQRLQVTDRRWRR